MTFTPIHTKKISIALAVDHLIFLQSLSNLLSLCGTFDVLIESSTVDELLVQFESLKTDVLVLDILFASKSDGILILSKIRGFFPEIKIIFLTLSNDVRFLAQLLEFGIYAFLNKNADFEELKASIFSAANNVPYCNNFTISIAKQFRQSSVRKEDEESFFSLREREVLRMIVEGKTNIEIAKSIYVSRRTVEQIRQKMKDRLKIKSTNELIKYAVERNIV